MLRGEWEHKANLLMTSPPYSGVTDYWNDHWIRLWILGHSMKKNWGRSARFGNLEKYCELLVDVLVESKRHLAADGTVLIRSDKRRRTWQACLDAIRTVWPGEDVYIRSTAASHNGASMNHFPDNHTANEVDFLVAGHRSLDWGREHGFRIVERLSDEQSP